MKIVWFLQTLYCESYVLYENYVMLDYIFKLNKCIRSYNLFTMYLKIIYIFSLIEMVCTILIFKSIGRGKAERIGYDIFMWRFWDLWETRSDLVRRFRWEIKFTLNLAW